MYKGSIILEQLPPDVQRMVIELRDMEVSDFDDEQDFAYAMEGRAESLAVELIDIIGEGWRDAYHQLLSPPPPEPVSFDTLVDLWSV